MNPLNNAFASLCKTYHELGYTTAIYEPRFINEDEWVLKVRKNFSEKLEKKKSSHEELKQKFTLKPVLRAGLADKDALKRKMVLLEIHQDLENVKSIIKHFKNKKRKPVFAKIEKRINKLEKKVEAKFKGL